MILGDTIVPWLLGALFLLALLTLAGTIRTWRDMKRSPYFFMRRQAEKRMQTFSLASLALFVVAAFTARLAWQAAPDNTPRVAILENTKPPKEDIVALVRESTAEEPEPFADQVTTAIEPESANANPATELQGADDTLVQATPVTPVLPQELSQLEPLAEIEGSTAIGNIHFSTEIADNYEAINPRRIFAEGFYTLYATFGFEEMVNGLEWSWVWRHNGAVIDGGNELWNYGRKGLGYIYLSPQEGFKSGEYGLEVWVNGEMLSQSVVTMNNAAVSAGN